MMDIASMDSWYCGSIVVRMWAKENEERGGRAGGADALFVGVGRERRPAIAARRGRGPEYAVTRMGIEAVEAGLVGGCGG
jgi:hypothetical protein